MLFSNKYAGRSDLFEGLSIWKEKSPDMYLLCMLMYGKEASNRKQAIDQHYTIPNQRKQRPKDKHYE